MSQSERVLAYLQSHDGLDPATAYREIGTMRLAARVSDLRALGHPIVTDYYVTRKGTRVALYRLEDTQRESLGL